MDKDTVDRIQRDIDHAEFEISLINDNKRCQVAMIYLLEATKRLLVEMIKASAVNEQRIADSLADKNAIAELNSHQIKYGA